MPGMLEALGSSPNTLEQADCSLVVFCVLMLKANRFLYRLSWRKCCVMVGDSPNSHPTAGTVANVLPFFFMTVFRTRLIA